MSSLLSRAFRRKKSVLPPTHSALEKSLTLFDLTLLGIGGTLGSGLFLLTGRAARFIAGPAVALSFLVAAIACLFSAFAYAELSSRFPNSGGAYSFAYTALGELPAFLVGMCLTLEYGISSAAIARSWASYLGDALPIFPALFVGREGGWCILGFLLILVVATLLAVGMKEAKWVINTATLLYGLVVFVIIIFGSRTASKENWHPFLPFGMNGVIAGASAVFFAYVGFDEVACVAEEAHNASTTVPVAIILSLLTVTSLYIIASLVLTGMVNYREISIAAPFSAAFRDVNMPVLAKLVGFGTALGMMNTTLVSLAAQPRIFYSMGRDGLLPASFARSTRLTTLGCGAVVSLLALVVETKALADVVSGGTLFAFLTTNTSLLLVRSRMHSQSRRVPYLIAAFLVSSVITSVLSRLVAAHAFPFVLALFICIPALLIPALFLLMDDFGDVTENSQPSFRCPFIPVFPLSGMFVTTFLLFQLSSKALAAFLIWLTASAIIYCFFGASNSLLQADYHVVDTVSREGSYNSFDIVETDTSEWDPKKEALASPTAQKDLNMAEES